MAAFQKTCKVNWPHGTETNVVPNFVTKTSALKMDYINWESLADNKAAWKQELSCNLKKGNSPSKKSLKRNAGEGKSPRYQMHIQMMTLFYMRMLKPPLHSHTSGCTATLMMLICRLDECYLHSLTRLTDVNELEICIPNPEWPRRTDKSQTLKKKQHTQLCILLYRHKQSICYSLTVNSAHTRVTTIITVVI